MQQVLPIAPTAAQTATTVLGMYAIGPPTPALARFIKPPNCLWVGTQSQTKRIFFERTLVDRMPLPSFSAAISQSASYRFEVAHSCGT